MNAAGIRLGVASLASLVIASCGKHVVVGREEAAMTDAGSGASDAGPDASGVDAGPLPDAGEIRCGAKLCGVVDFGAPVGEGKPCCFGPSRCGGLLSTACVELDVQGVEDPSCPSLPPYVGCCRTDNTCGFVAGAPLGCVGSPLGSTGTCVYPDR